MEVFGEALGFEAAGQAREAERLGYDGIVAVDHFYSARAPAAPRWRGQQLIALGAAAASTTRIRLAAMVANVNFHHPGVIAHALATLDRTSGGRAELGLGSGWYAPEHHAFGLPWGSPEERLARLLESARICRAMFANQGVVSFRGVHFAVENAVPWDWTARVPLIIGGASPKMLRRAAEVADRIDLLHASVDGIPVVDERLTRSAARVEELLAEVRDHAAAVGNAVALAATPTVTVVGDEAGPATRRQLAQSLGSSEALLERDLLYHVGTQRELIEKIRTLAQLGVDRLHMIPGPLEPDHTASALREMLGEIQAISV